MRVVPPLMVKAVTIQKLCLQQTLLQSKVREALVEQSAQKPYQLMSQALL
jgi:hypothetical protein